MGGNSPEGRLYVNTFFQERRKSWLPDRINTIKKLPFKSCQSLLNVCPQVCSNFKSIITRDWCQNVYHCVFSSPITNKNIEKEHIFSYKLKFFSHNNCTGNVNTLKREMKTLSTTDDFCKSPNQAKVIKHYVKLEAIIQRCFWIMLIVFLSFQQE